MGNVNWVRAASAWGPGNCVGFEAASDARFGLEAFSNSSNAVYVHGPVSGGLAALYSEGNSGHAVFGDGEQTGKAGISGGHTLSGGGSSNRWAIWAFGDIGASGTKYFVHPHPRDANRTVAFVCLEGNESGTYFRGTANIAGGVAEIATPEEWRLVTAEEGITVQVTPAALANLAVTVKTRDRIVVIGSADVQFDYLVNGVRQGYPKHKAIIENMMFRPEVIGLEYGHHLPPGVRELLVQNGTLNHDYTPNLETAARLGWPMRMPTATELQQAVERMSHATSSR